MAIKFKSHDYRDSEEESKLLEARVDSYCLRLLTMIMKAPKDDFETSSTMVAAGMALGAMMCGSGETDMTPEEMLLVVKPYVLAGASKMLKEASPLKKAYFEAANAAILELGEKVDLKPREEDTDRPELLAGIATSGTRH